MNYLRANLATVGTLKVLYKEAPFLKENVLLSYTFCWQMVPFYILILELCTPFNRWKCTVFQIWINHKTRTFSQLFNSHKMHMLALRTFYTRNGRFPFPFIHFNKWISYSFIYLIRVPRLGGAFPYWPLWGASPPPGAYLAAKKNLRKHRWSRGSAWSACVHR